MKDVPPITIERTLGDQYLEANKMHLHGVYATQVEIFATAFLIGKDIHTWVGIQGLKGKADMAPRWQSHFASGDPKTLTKNGLYLSNINEQFNVI